MGIFLLKTKSFNPPKPFYIIDRYSYRGAKILEYIIDSDLYLVKAETISP